MLNCIVSHGFNSMQTVRYRVKRWRPLHTFNVIDVGLSLPSERVIRSLEQIIEWRGKPKAIRCDNGPEYISQKLLNWADSQGISLMGKPTQNAYIERFNRTVREECLDLYLFESVSDAEAVVTEWMWLYNNERPHSAVGKIPPRKVLELTAT